MRTRRHPYNPSSLTRRTAPRRRPTAGRQASPRQRTYPTQYRCGEGLNADNEADIKIKRAVIHGHQHPARPAMAAPIINTSEITRSVLMPRMAAIRRSCWVARQTRPNCVVDYPAQHHHADKGGEQDEDFGPVICTTPSPTVSRSTPCINVGIPVDLGPDSVGRSFVKSATCQ